MKRTLLLSLTGIVFIALPSVTQAAWWDPSSWFVSPAPVVIEKIVEKEVPITQLVYVPATSTQVCTPKVITKTVTAPSPSQDALIQSLQAHIASLQSQLNQKPAVASVVLAMPLTSGPIKAIKLQLLQLESLEKMIQMYGGDTATTSAKFRKLMTTLASTKNSDGTPVFNEDAFLPHIVWLNPDYNENNNPPKFEWILEILNKTRTRLMEELKVAEASQ